MKIILIAIGTFCLIAGVGSDLRAQSSGDQSGWTEYTCLTGCGTSAWGVSTEGSPSGITTAYTPCIGAGCLNPVNGAYEYQSLPSNIGNSYTLTVLYNWNTDGTTDLTVFLNGNVILADLIGNTSFSVADLASMSASAIQQVGGGPGSSNAVVSALDLALLAPEPASFLLAGTALLALGLKRIRGTAAR